MSWQHLNQPCVAGLVCTSLSLWERPSHQPGWLEQMQPILLYSTLLRAGGALAVETQRPAMNSVLVPRLASRATLAVRHSSIYVLTRRYGSVCIRVDTVEAMLASIPTVTYGSTLYTETLTPEP